jgi:hypothetical protein
MMTPLVPTTDKAFSQTMQSIEDNDIPIKSQIILKWWGNNDVNKEL